MDKFVIHGGKQLSGEIMVSGSKNAALPLLAAGLLADGKCVIHNVPDLADIRSMIDLLGDLGVDISRRDDGAVAMETVDQSCCHARYERVRKMRASISVLGPMLAKRGYARVSMPGGCAIGSRPIDLHLRGLSALGADITLDNGDVVARADKLKGAEIFMGGPFGATVLGTLNVMSAAVLADGITIIEAAACEPEVVDVADFLNSMGARISGAGTPRLVIEGVESLDSTQYTVMPDRIEAGTFIIAAAMTRSKVLVNGGDTRHMMAVVDKLRESGVSIERVEKGVLVLPMAGPPRPVDVTTQPYPGFPTDLQAQLMVFLAMADGNSAITEKIFPDRFMHVPELQRMGANIRKEGVTAIVTGVQRLIGAPVMASDLRASAALVLAGMIAEGTSEVLRVYHIDRGYEKIEQKLNGIGAAIERVAE